VSRLNDLIRQLREAEPQLAQDLEREVAALADRRAFGLNFERHVPEAVELPDRRVRKGDKVRILPPRVQAPKKENEALWRVVGIDRSEGLASLVLLDGDGATETSIEDLVVVAEFRDPIYPGIVSTGKVERGGDKPYHAVINAENYHALETLLFTHRGKVDAIYIDPPYNTGAKDWKYNNNYVESDDLYRHSKWLAFIERRLLLARELLKPEDSVLIVTIDEKEYLRLGLLLEQLFPAARIQMVSSVINPKGQSRSGQFARSDEYLFFVGIGSSSPRPLHLGPEWQGTRATTTTKLRWVSMIRSGTGVSRSDRPGMFFPVLLNAEDGSFVSIGDALPSGVPSTSFQVPFGAVAVWPIREDGTEGRWQVGPETARALRNSGFLRVGRFNGDATAISYLKSGEHKKVSDGVYGEATISAAGHIEVEGEATATARVPTTQWALASHSASEHGSRMLRNLIPGREFDYPKSLYAVEDSLRFYLTGKHTSLVVDFFAGSGTTAHAVMRLNKQDGGRRQSISITNNEVGADEQKRLRGNALRPGDPGWESRGICELVTKPRIRAAITGKVPGRAPATDGEPIKGEYRFTDPFPMADGFEENVEFFTLTYEAPLRVASNREFGKIAPLLWLRAGSRGRRIENISVGWDVADVYGVLADLDQTENFLKGIAARGDDIEIAFIVTDEDRLFESIAQELPEQVEPVRLYEAYLRNFEIESGRGAL
jgi:adenine-specific DNA-methyltransferase